MYSQSALVAKARLTISLLLIYLYQSLPSNVSCYFQIDLKEIDEKYKELTNCSLTKEIESHLKGHVKDLSNLILERSERG